MYSTSRAILRISSPPLVHACWSWSWGWVGSLTSCRQLSTTSRSRKQSSRGKPRDKLSHPDPPSPQHSDLASFVCYAKRTGLDETSTVYIGTHYEYTVARSLSRYGFDLGRIGGSFDKGTDLVGTWTLPAPLSSPLSMRVLVQCKAGSQRLAPRHVRELEGAFVGAPVGWRGTGVLGLLVSEYSATKGVRDSLGRSQWPMVCMCCSRDGIVSQMLWNQRARELGLEAYGVSVRHGGPGGLVLMHNGKTIPLREC
ncbi:hypothetical protein E4U43_006640 [Claviceps pusilla]|uniref:Uncharacterized protein n=1 Tax=Claviceps pusilla TaxID=123648 RepID=A0A9P7NDJ4_9HYPO|nr:hypothetical protein E4U43_006640 [Claviceps pusilla]